MQPVVLAPGQRLVIRVVLAVFGGYALASAFTIALPPLLPMPRAQAVLAATLLGFVVHVVAALWAFAQSNLRCVAVGLLVPTVMLAALGLALRETGA